MDKNSDQQKYNKSEQKLLKKIQANILDIIDPKNEIDDYMKSVEKYQKRVGVQSELLADLKERNLTKLLNLMESKYGIKMGNDNEHVSIDHWIEMYTTKKTGVIHPKPSSNKGSLFAKMKKRFTGTSKRGGRSKNKTRRKKKIRK